MAEEFVVGDVVQLKSGGSWMTIEKLNRDGVSCVWFEGENLNRDSFSSDDLQRQ